MNLKLKMEELSLSDRIRKYFDGSPGLRMSSKEIARSLRAPQPQVAAALREVRAEGFVELFDGLWGLKC